MNQKAKKVEKFNEYCKFNCDSCKLNKYNLATCLIGADCVEEKDLDTALQYITLCEKVNKVSMDINHEYYQKGFQDALKMNEHTINSLKKKLADLEAKFVVRPKVLYALENTETGNISFNCKGGCYKTQKHAKDKASKLGKEYRVIEYELKESK